MSPSPSTPCRLCGRFTKRSLTEHHLIPVTCHRNKWFQKNFTREQMRCTIDVCPDCHGAIHRFEPREKNLGRYWNTVEKLQSHPQLSRFLAWVSKQK
ncbi:hypothetical protein [Lignipirellula cremea]|uniref:HNH domain-containing protein n=1 Tax=Lignipirellula cremea TaxID=2528010 RepID=A0A518DS98_9BACT|nr:hypothetical protein [Lignipirellula cremea]QDU94658.1 hypothetical protein Pla8534_24640 [Lignipirellula cremea]